MNNKIKTLALSLTSLLFLLFTTHSALAHKVRVFTYVDGDKIVGETAFSGGRAPKNSEIVVKDASSGKLLTTTKTDDKGNFSFPIPAEAKEKKLDLLIIVKAGEGHQGQWKMTADEYLEDTVPLEKNADAGTSSQVDSNSQVLVPAPAAASQATATQSVIIDQAALKKIIDDSLDKKLAPVKRMLSESMDQGPGLQDILGGIGFLIGIAGIISYINAIKKSNQGGKND